MTTTALDQEAKQAKAMEIMAEARRQLEAVGVQASLITRCPAGSRWPVLMLEAGETFADIEAARKG